MSTTTNTTLAEDARTGRALKESRDEAKAAHTDLSQQYSLWQRDFLQRLEDEEAEGIKTEGINFVPAKTVYGSIQDRSEFVAWAETHAPELIEQKERKALINQLVRERQDNGEPLPPGVGFYIDAYISQRAT